MVEERDSSCLLSELRETFKSGRTRSFEWRKTQLEAMLNMLTHQEHSCFQALDHDLGKTHVETYKDEIPLRRDSYWVLLYLGVILLAVFALLCWLIINFMSNFRGYWKFNQDGQK